MLEHYKGYYTVDVNIYEDTDFLQDLLEFQSCIEISEINLCDNEYFSHTFNVFYRNIVEKRQLETLIQKYVPNYF